MLCGSLVRCFVRSVLDVGKLNLVSELCDLLGLGPTVTIHLLGPDYFNNPRIA